MESKVKAIVPTYTPISEPHAEASTSNSQASELADRLLALQCAHDAVERENARLKDEVKGVIEKLSKIEEEKKMKKEDLITTNTELLSMKRHPQLPPRS